MLDFLFSEALMAKIGVALVAALVAITFGKILLSMVGRFLNFRDEHPLFRLYDGVLSFVPGYSDFWSFVYVLA